MRWIQLDGKRFEDAAVFFRVKEEWGCLSNMAGGFPLVVCGYDVPSSEALYQAMRFPNSPEIQREIIAQGSPMAAKMMAKKEQRRERLTRADWSEIQLDVMRWCLRVKLVQNFGEFFETLMASKERPIVERSRKDRFWGAVLEDDGHLHGENWLGRLLMELRDEVAAWLNSGEDDAPYPPVVPPAIENFRLLKTEIGVIGVE
jgi:ribA/ribD-fused uncharacterized protein